MPGNLPAQTTFVFLCLGNVCRSPLAEGYFRKVTKDYNLSRHFGYASAGLASWNTGNPPDSRAQLIARQYDFDISGHRAQMVDPRDIDRFYHFISMDKDSKHSVKQLFPTLREERNHLLLDFTADMQGHDVPDPYSGDTTEFDNSMQFIRHGIHGFVRQMVTHIKQKAA